LELENDPCDMVSRLGSPKFYKIGVGNYGIILYIQQGKLIIFVIETDHRKRVYGKSKFVILSSLCGKTRDQLLLFPRSC